TGSLDARALNEVDVLISLAGSSIGKGFWTISRKRDLRESRIRSIQTICETLSRKNLRIPMILQASAIGYYGDRGSEILTEKSAPENTGFLSDMAQDWEREAEAFMPFTEHLARLRTGLYLHPTGGLWPMLNLTARFGFLNYFGDGSAYYSWIHHEDYVRAIAFIIDHQLDGPINLTAPKPLPNKDLIKQAAMQYPHSKRVFGIPGFLIKMGMGEQAQLVLDSQRVLPQALLDKGFRFKYEQFEKAARKLIAAGESH
ncbi:MAG TPA: TIGR01777 family oxidoreductase, partial [Saprospiraceae bacterium]|nr:TIGR01777 family oxidoreductase [Saprospiraceae bacterium]